LIDVNENKETFVTKYQCKILQEGRFEGERGRKECAVLLLVILGLGCRGVKTRLGARRFQELSEYFVNDIHSLLVKEIAFVSSFTSLEDIEKVRKNELKIGKLSKKFEPAGKVRVFAIVDN